LTFSEISIRIGRLLLKKYRHSNGLGLFVNIFSTCPTYVWDRALERPKTADPLDWLRLAASQSLNSFFTLFAGFFPIEAYSLFSLHFSPALYLKNGVKPTHLTKALSLKSSKSSPLL
jgi:hypothetical protein